MEKPSASGAVAAAYALAAVALVAWLILLPGLASLDSSDAAGNAMAQGFAALQAIVAPRLCGAALAHLREDDFDKAYRPTADDPRRYGDLLEQLGAGAPLTALQWLAGHGCDAEAELAEAESIVKAYQDSPERQAMLASLAALRRR